MIFSFDRPIYLFLLISIPFLIFLHFYLLRGRRSYALKFSNFEAIARIRGVELYSKNVVVLIFTILIILLLVFSLSGLNISKELKTSAFSFIVGIDSSRSMEAVDILPSRIDAAKATAVQFVDTSPFGIKLGIISFSGYPVIEQDLTQDKILIKEAINNIEISSIGGTDISAAIFVAATLLNKEENKAVVLLSDGQINLGNLSETISYAKERNIIVHTIAIGKGTGETSYGLSTLDESSLKSIAYGTGGKFFKAESAEDLLTSFDSLRELKLKTVKIEMNFDKTETNTPTHNIQKNLS